MEDLYQRYANIIQQFKEEGEPSEFKDAVIFFQTLARFEENKSILCAYVMNLPMSKAAEVEAMVDSLEDNGIDFIFDSIY
jgi:hypothetical protein